MLNKKVLLAGTITCIGAALLLYFVGDPLGARANYTAGIILIWLWGAA